ncbi:MAG: UDP-N-acetylmuramate dehydrogenase [Proteobacteria bacterium]|nr:UDP-N-acetylmuramate dehydrogenase [Pseudomonadota bacterium]
MTALISRLPSVRGKYQTNISMAEHTWFGVGGAAEVLFTPADAEDLHTFLKALDADIPVYPVGAGSNLLVRDGGVSGVIISTKAIKHHHIEGTHLTVGSGWLDAEVARLASRENIAGLEFLIGIPGTIGGGLRMNAGAFGKEFRDVVMTATAIDRQGNWHEVTPAKMGMAYRHSNAPLDWIFVSATLIGESGKSEDIRAAMKAIIATRSDAQPQGVRTGGSTFANPEGHKAWQLIDQAGCRGLAHGAAEVSEKHCNFLINRGNASAEDIETLGETIRDRVKATSQVDLRWEIRRIGKTASGGKHEQD